jgi:LysR family transcriptional regulator, chromosome initiation inhibitor
MRYHPMATPAYVERHFPEGPTAESFQRAPAIVFGPHDQLQHRFLSLFGYHGSFPYHLCPSSEGFVRLAAAGIGYGMMPQLQVGELMNSGHLVSVTPGRFLSVPLYWHFWRHSGQLIQRLTQQLSHINY